MNTRKSDVKIELTEDWQGLKEGDVLTRSRDIASLHINHLKNAKPYVKAVVKKAKVKK